MPAEDADRLLRAADADAALTYIYLMRRGAGDEEKMASELGMTPQRLKSALRTLAANGLLHEKPRRPSDAMPEYETEYVVARSREDAAFRGVLAEAERVLGRTLGTADTKTLFGVYDYVGLPTEVICLLLNYCAEECRRRYGPGRVPTVRQIEREAYVWSDREIMTIELAEEYIRQREAERENMDALRRAFGIHDRQLTPTERKYLESWLAMGFPQESLELAYDRTVTNLGQLRWSYMNKIVLSWQEKGLHTPQEIEKGDAPSRRPRTVKRDAQGTAERDATDEKLEQVRRAYEKLRKG